MFDISKINEFREELQEQITAAQAVVASLDAIIGGTTTVVVSRPSKNLISMPGTAKTGRRKFSAAQRKEQSMRMKAFWAKRHKGMKKAS